MFTEEILILNWIEQTDLSHTYMLSTFCCTSTNVDPMSTKSVLIEWVIAFLHYLQNCQQGKGNNLFSAAQVMRLDGLGFSIIGEVED